VRVESPGLDRAPEGQSTEATRQRILAVALELIAQKGFAATSTREISERLGFTKAALYYHFRSKQELLLALMRPILDHLAGVVEAGETHEGPGRPARVLAGYVDLVAENEEPIRVLSQDPAARRPPASLEAAALYERIMELLTGQAEPDVAGRARARAALAAIHSIFIFAAPDDDRRVLHAVALTSASRALGLPERE